METDETLCCLVRLLSVSLLPPAEKPQWRSPVQDFYHRKFFTHYTGAGPSEPDISTLDVILHSALVNNPIARKLLLMGCLRFFARSERAANDCQRYLQLVGALSAELLAKESQWTTAFVTIILQTRQVELQRGTAQMLFLSKNPSEIPDSIKHLYHRLMEGIALQGKG